MFVTVGFFVFFFQFTDDPSNVVSGFHIEDVWDKIKKTLLICNEEKMTTEHLEKKTLPDVFWRVLRTPVEWKKLVALVIICHLLGCFFFEGKGL